MSDRLRICAVNNVDDSRCVLSCSVSPILPLANLQNTLRERLFRAASTTAVDIKGTYGGDAVGISCVSIQRANLTSAATWRFQAYSTADWTGTPVIDSTTLTPIPAIPLGSLFFGVDPAGLDKYHVLLGKKQATLWFTRTAALSWKLTLTDTLNPAGVIDISRLIVGDNHLEVGVNPRYGLRLGVRDTSSAWETDNGSERVDAGELYRVLTFGLENISETDRQRWIEILFYCGTYRDVLVSVYPEGTDEQIRDYTINGRFKGPLPDLTATFVDRNSADMTFREA